MESVNLATYYRPKTFSEVVGQDLAVSALKKIALTPGISCRAIFLKGSYGSGKCVDPESIIKTDEGLRKAKCLKVGQEFHICGKSNSIVVVQDNSETEVYKIETEGGKTIKVTGNHPVLVWSGKQFNFKQALELQEGDIVVEDLTKVPYDYNDFDEDAYMMGLLTGDGTLSIESSRTIEFLTTDIPLKEWVEQYCKKTHTYYTCQEVEREGFLNQYRFLFNAYSRLNIICQEQNLVKHVAYTKIVPKDFWVWKFYQQVSFLQGVMDTDGSCDRGGSIELGLSSKELLQDLSTICSGLGFDTRLVKRLNNHLYKDNLEHYSYRLFIHSTRELSLYKYLFRLDRKKNLCHDKVCVSQSKKFRFKGMADVMRNIIYSCGCHYSNEDRKTLNTCHNGEFSLLSTYKWQNYLRNRGVECDVLPEDVSPDYVKSITKEVVAKTIDIQCSGDPIFYTSGIITHNTTLCKVFGKAMNCSNLTKNNDVCNECDNCKEVESKNSQLYLEYDSSVVGNVEGVKNLYQKLEVSPKGRRVVVLDECQACSRQALNSLLKIVEEGIKNTVFVFASTEDILDTIKSRCVCIDIDPIPLNLIKNRVKEIADLRHDIISDENLTLLAMKSKGHMRDALSTLQFYELVGEKALTTSYSTFHSFIFKLLSKSHKLEALPLIDELMTYNIVDIQNSINSFIRSLFVAKEGTNEFILLRNGAANMLFQYFFSPVATQALKSEVGIEILLRELYDRFTKTK